MSRRHGGHASTHTAPPRGSLQRHLHYVTRYRAPPHPYSQIKRDQMPKAVINSLASLAFEKEIHKQQTNSSAHRGSRRAEEAPPAANRELARLPAARPAKPPRRGGHHQSLTRPPKSRGTWAGRRPQLERAERQLRWLARLTGDAFWSNGGRAGSSSATAPAEDLLESAVWETV